MPDNASINRLKLSKFKLDTLLDFTQAINNNLPADELLKKVENVLRRDLNIGKIGIFMHSRDAWELILESGCTRHSCKNIPVEEVLLPVTEIDFVSATEEKSLEEFDIIIPVYNNNAPLAFVLIGDIDEEETGISPVIKHLHFIQTLSNIVIVAIENIRLFEESLKQEALRKELELASKMQSLLIPDNDALPRNKHLFVTGFYNPHYDVGGDYYDCIQLNGNEFAFCIADVSGKGMSAALLMANFQATIRALFTPEIKLETLVRKLNKSVVQNASGEKFITLFVAKYNSREKVLEYINAAHNPPVFFETQSRRITKFESSCVGIGMLDEIPAVKAGRKKINEESKIICYTDGLSELKDKKGKELGTRAIEKYIKLPVRVDENIQQLIDQENINDTNANLFDDISIMGLQFYPGT